MKRKLIRLLSAMLVLVLAAGLLPSFASAAEPQAKDVAAAYLNVLKSIIVYSNQIYYPYADEKNQVTFCDVWGDSVPEMIVMDYPASCTAEAQFWTYQNGKAKKMLTLDWSGYWASAGSQYWVYSFDDGRIGVYEKNGPSEGGAYYTAGTNGVYTKSDYFGGTDMSVYDPQAGFEGHINGKPATKAAVKAEEKKMRAGVRIFDFAVQNDSDETGEMTLSEARSFLNGIKGRFWDVPSNAFYANPVNWAVQNNVTSGRDALHFAPEETVKRGEAMLFFYAAKGKPGHKTATSPFKDVKKKHWYYDAVLWAVENKITSGTDATHFSPNKTCVRSEILQFLYAAMGKPGYTIANPYSDVKDKHWYKDGAIWAYEKGLEKGENGKFKANTPCIRAYVVTYLYRFITGRELVK